MIIPKSINRRLLQRYRPSSIETFTNNLKNVLQNAYNKDKYTLKPLKADIQPFIDYVQTLNTQSSQKNTASAVLAFLKADPRTPDDIIEKYQKYFDNLAKIIDEDKQYQEPTKEEEEAFIPWEDVLKVYKKHEKIVQTYPDQNFTSYEDKYIYLKYLLLTLYTTIPPLRGEEYRNAIIIRVKNKDAYPIITEACKCNLVDLEHNNLVIPFYKTSKTHETRIIPIPKKTSEVIQRWYRLTKGNKYLLPNLQTPSERMSQTALSHLLQRIFKPHNISTSMLRKIYISYKMKTIYNKPAERKKLAKTMGHTLALQEFIYNRFKE